MHTKHGRKRQTCHLHQTWNIKWFSMALWANLNIVYDLLHKIDGNICRTMENSWRTLTTWKKISCHPHCWTSLHEVFNCLKKVAFALHSTFTSKHICSYTNGVLIPHTSALTPVNSRPVRSCFNSTHKGLNSLELRSLWEAVLTPHTSALIPVNSEACEKLF